VLREQRSAEHCNGSYCLICFQSEPPIDRERDSPSLHLLNRKRQRCDGGKWVERLIVTAHAWRSEHATRHATCLYWRRQQFQLRA
jgi:hypothetical protein